MQKNLSLLIFFLTGLVYNSCSFSQTEETLTITTYYPSPYGVYAELRLFPSATKSTFDCDAAEEVGKMYYDNTDRTIKVCRQRNPSIPYDYGWDVIGAAVGYWSRSAASGRLYPTTISDNLGIGTSTPDSSARLDVVSTNSGLLIPRVSLTSSTDTTTISSPATSLLVYNTGTGGLSPAGFYYWGGASWGPAFGSPHGKRRFPPASGTFTVPAGVTTVWVSMSGGGGGSSGSSRITTGGAGGGGAHAIIAQPLTVTPGATYSITVGAGGAGSAGSTLSSSVAGGNGGASSFGALFSTPGGFGGAAGGLAGGAAGGAGGVAGVAGIVGGVAGGSIFGVGGLGAAAGGAGFGGAGFGGGGGGGGRITAGGAGAGGGGAGSPGFVLVEW